MADGTSELIVASNRLPVEVERTDHGLRLHPSPGGLASALRESLTDRGSAWVGWPGVAGPVDLEQAAEPPELPYRLVPVALSADEVEDYYEGFANEILWPLFHDLTEYCEFEPRFWNAYRSVNRRFARTLAEQGGGEAWLWIHDYHLLLVGARLRDLGDDRPAGFFLHTPFPPADTLDRLPWVRGILEAFTRYDLVGLQTRRDVANLRKAAETLADTLEVERGDGRLFLTDGEERAEVGFFPISVDVEQLEDQARTPEVDNRAAQLRETLGPQRTYVVGVERLDYTKGILERLRTFRCLLERREELAEEVTLVQHVNPSREGIPQYEELQARIDRAVDRINAEHRTPDWQPIRYTYGQLAFEEILALYRLADVALVTSLVDGMNLVAKEYCAANVDEEGVLVLSKFAGAAEELCDNALVINPHDVERSAQILHEACTMPREERRRRMRNLREHLRDHDVHRWARTFLERLDPDGQPSLAASRSVDLTMAGSLRRPPEEG